MYYQDAKAYALKRLQEEIPDNLYYHGIHHTLDVCQAAHEIAMSENIGGEDLSLLSTAAMFHDIGFIDQYQDHEITSCQIAEAALPRFGYTPPQIEIITSIIMATCMPQNPQTHLEEIMCDADLDYLGRSDFFKIAHTLQKEWIAFGVITPEYNWNEKQVQFLENHHYFTKTAREKREVYKKKNLLKLKMLQ